MTLIHPPSRGVHLSFTLYKIIEASFLCFNYFSVAFLFFVPLIGAHGTPPYATSKDQQFHSLWSLQNPYPHSEHFIVLFLLTKPTLLHQVHLSILCAFLFQYSQRAKIFPNLYRTCLY